MEKMYQLVELLEASKFFCKQEGAQEELEKNLREIEGEKRNIRPENIEIISYSSLVTAIQQLSVCFDKVVKAILRKFSELGYKPFEV